MIVNIVVFFAVAMSVLFLVAWGLSKELRARIEQPKFDFLARLQQLESVSNTRSGSEGNNNVL
ncbi:MAG: hypothetical protein R3332_05795 [Pseudohongiellaceae bacterium]|nr:hypothetical protein [Pseudohongiellaceae bacterium]